MDYKKEIDNRLKKLFKNKPMTEDELRVLAEILTFTREEGYEAGYKDGVAESMKGGSDGR